MSTFRLGVLNRHANLKEFFFRFCLWSSKPRWKQGEARLALALAISSYKWKGKTKTVGQNIKLGIVGGNIKAAGKNIKLEIMEGNIMAVNIKWEKGKGEVISSFLLIKAVGKNIQKKPGKVPPQKKNFYKMVLAKNIKLNINYRKKSPRPFKR